MKDYSDFYAVSWQKSRPVPTFWHMVLHGMPVWIPLVVLYVIGAWYVSGRLIDVTPELALWVLLIAGFFFFWMLAILWRMIIKARGRTIVSYRIDKDGISIDDKTYAYTDIDTAQLAANMKLIQGTDSAVLELGRTMVLWKIALRFTDQTNKDAALKALAQYLNL